MITRADIKEEIRKLEALKISYDIFDYGENIVQEKIISKAIAIACQLFEACKYWMEKHRDGYLVFHLDAVWNELMESQWYGKVGYSNWSLIDQGIRYIRRSVFNAP